MPLQRKTLAEMKAELEDLRRKLHRFKAVKAENRRLRQDLERLAELVESTNDPATIVDWKGKFLYLNHSAQALLGISPEQGLGLSACAFVHPEDRDQTRKWFVRQVDAGQDCGEIETRQVGPAGEVRYLFWASRFHYDETGELTHVSSIGRDITSSKKTGGP